VHKRNAIHMIYSHTHEQTCSHPHPPTCVRAHTTTRTNVRMHTRIHTHAQTSKTVSQTDWHMQQTLTVQKELLLVVSCSNIDRFANVPPFHLPLLFPPCIGAHTFIVCHVL